jgi:membrane dipeptidase
MTVPRREFLKIVAAGAMFPSGFLSTSSRPFSSAEIDRLFENSVIIDTLSLAHKWDGVAFSAIKESGYTAIQTSLSNRNLEVAVQALSEWNRRVEEHPDIFVKATSAADIEHAKRDGKLAVIYGFQNTTMVEDDVDNVDVL